MKKVVLLLLTSCSGKEIITTDSIYAFGTTGKVDEACQIMKETITSKEDRDVVAKIEFRDAQKRKQEEVEKAYSKKVYEKWKDLTYKLHFTSERTFLHSQRNGSLYIGALLQLDDFDFILELIKNLKIVYRNSLSSSYEFRLSSIDNMLIKGSSVVYNTCVKDFDFNKVFASDQKISSDDLIMMLLKKKITDKKFIDLLCKKDPVSSLNKYNLTDEHIHEKDAILKRLNSGGYVLKVVDFSYYTDYSNDEYGEQVRVNEFGKDVLGTFLLREYCMKK